MNYTHSTTAANICRAFQMLKGYDNPGRVSFYLGLYFLCHAQILADLSSIPQRETGCDPAVPVQLCLSSGSSFPHRLYQGWPICLRLGSTRKFLDN